MSFALCRQTLAEGELGLTDNEENSRARKEAGLSEARETPSILLDINEINPI
jgi:hypothetical protein